MLVAGVGRGVQGGRNGRGERRARDLGDRVADRDAAVAHIRIEDHGEQRSGYSDGGGHGDTEDQYLRGHEQPGVSGVDQCEGRADRHPHGDGAEQVHGLAAEGVRQGAEDGVEEDGDEAGDEHAGQGEGAADPGDGVP